MDAGALRHLLTDDLASDALVAALTTPVNPILHYLSVERFGFDRSRQTIDVRVHVRCLADLFGCPLIHADALRFLAAFEFDDKPRRSPVLYLELDPSHM